MHEVLTWPVGRAADDDPDATRPPIVPVLTYSGAAVIGGTIAAGAIGALGLAVDTELGVNRVIIVAALIPLVWLSLVCQWAGRVDPLPERRAQVPTRWLQWGGPSRIAFAFGVMIGSGGMTYLRHAVAWTLAAIILLTPSSAAAIAVGAIYGAARAAPLMVTWALDRADRPRPNWRALGAVDGPLSRALVVLGAACFLVVGLNYWF